MEHSIPQQAHVTFLDRTGSAFGSRAEHVCSRACSFAHVVGNVYICQSSGETHVCDQNCRQRVAMDSHTAICRLSKRAFPIKRAELADRKRCASEETTTLEAEAAKVRRVAWY